MFRHTKIKVKRSKVKVTGAVAYCGGLPPSVSEEKVDHFHSYDNFGKSGPIFIIFHWPTCFLRHRV